MMGKCGHIVYLNVFEVFCNILECVFLDYSFTIGTGQQSNDCLRSIDGS